jgi:hypothetical protein
MPEGISPFYLDTFGLGPEQRAVAEAESPDEIRAALHLAEAPGFKSDLKHRLANTVASFARVFDVPLLRFVLSGRVEALHRLVANPHLRSEHVRWVLEEIARRAPTDLVVIGGTEHPVECILQALGIAARREALLLPTSSMDSLYRGVCSVADRPGSGARYPRHLAEDLLDRLYDATLDAPSAVRQSEVVLRAFEAQGRLELDLPGKACAGNVYTPAAELLRMYRRHPSTELLKATLGTGRFLDPEVRALAWDRTRGDAAWIPWLVLLAES